MTSESLQIVAFTIDGGDYAFAIAAVKEIIRYVEPQPTSAPQSWMRGVINLRGSIVPIMDLGDRLGLGPTPVDGSSAKILVLEDGDVTIGAVVSTVDEVRTVPGDQVQPAPGDAASEFVEAIVTLGDRLIMLLEPSALLREAGAPT